MLKLNPLCLYFSIYYFSKIYLRNSYYLSLSLFFFIIDNILEGSHSTCIVVPVHFANTRKFVRYDRQLTATRSSASVGASVFADYICKSPWDIPGMPRLRSGASFPPPPSLRLSPTRAHPRLVQYHYESFSTATAGSFENRYPLCIGEMGKKIFRENGKLKFLRTRPSVLAFVRVAIFYEILCKFIRIHFKRYFKVKKFFVSSSWKIDF